VLAARCRAGSIEVLVPDSGVRHRFAKQRLRARIGNRSDCAWPALGAGDRGLVMLEYAWLDDAGAVVVTGSPGRLGRDVPAGGEIEEPLFVLTPRPGTARRLRVTLRQQGQAEAIASWEAPVEVLGPGAAPPAGPHAQVPPPAGSPDASPGAA